MKSRFLRVFDRHRLRSVEARDGSAGQRRGLALALFAVAMVARIAVFGAGGDHPNNDELGYTELAVEIAAGRGFERRGIPESHISPLFPLLHALPIALGAEPAAAGRALGLLTSAAAAPLAAWAFWSLLGGRSAALGGLLVALHPRLLVTAERDSNRRRCRHCACCCSLRLGLAVDRVSPSSPPRSAISRDLSASCSYRWCGSRCLSVTGQLGAGSGFRRSSPLSSSRRISCTCERRPADGP